METRSRKRAEASSPSSSTPVLRSSKRARQSTPAASPPITRSHQNSRSMDSNPTESSSRRRHNHQRQAAAGDRHKDSGDKGKEKEPESRNVGLGIGASGVYDDDEEGVSILHQNLTSASSALQGLLRKLGAGFDDLLPSSGPSSSQQSGRFKKILSGLRADGEEGRQVESLTQLCEILSIGTEDSLGSFSVDSFVPVLVNLLNHESNADIMLLAARALTHLCDVLPSSCASVVHYGAVSCFCARLLTIEYMDLAEQSLQALEKISHEHPTACLRAGALMAVLSYLDFFSTGVQRVALATAANICKKLPSDASDFVMEAVPLLTNLLHYHDAKVLDFSSVCLTRIAESFASSPEKLDELCNHGLVTQAADLISVSNSGGGQASLSTSTYTGLIRLLSTCASGSPLSAKTLLLLGISNTLKDILSGCGLVASVFISPALTRPPEQIFETVSLANELLPPLPQGTISLPNSSNFLWKGLSGKRTSSGNNVKQEDAGAAVADFSARESLFREQPELLQQFGINLFPVLVQVYGSSVNSPVRHKCLSVISKLMYFSTADMIQSLSTATNISCFLAGVLAWKDPQVLIPAIQISEILMQKLPDTFSKMFVREGVVHAMDALISIKGSDAPSAQTSPAEKEQDALPSSRSRRYRRRSGASNPEADASEEPKGSVSIGSPPTNIEVPTVNSSLRAMVSACAKAFKDKYFSASSGAMDAAMTDDLLKLKNLCSKLNASVIEFKTKAKGKSKASGRFAGDLYTEHHLIMVISELLTELSKGDGVSTFEFIGSGVVAALLNYFSCGTFSKEGITESDIIKLRQQSLKRFKLFIEIALPSGGNASEEAPMTVLVQKLQNALTALERFPVILSHSSRSSGGTACLSSGLTALSQPIKLRLCRAQGEKALRDYSSNIVLIDPLASLAAVEEFLWSRVQRSDHGQKYSVPVGNTEPSASPTLAGGSSSLSASVASAHRHSTRSRSSILAGDSAKKDSHDGHVSSSKGKGKAVLKTSAEEPQGPQTRNAARRRASSEKDTQLKAGDANSSSEDDELDLSHVDIDDALVLEDDDISEDEDDDHDEVLGDDSPVCASEKVHDVKLGDTPEDAAVASTLNDNQLQLLSGSSNTNTSNKGTDPAEFRGGGPFGSKGAMSFAAAAMAGHASASRGGIRASRDHRGHLIIGNSNDPPKLLFSVGNKQLNRHLTIYQAIQRQLVLDEDHDERINGSDLLPNDGQRLWYDIYTITYRRAESQSGRTSAGASVSASLSRPNKTGSASNAKTDASCQHQSLFNSIIQGGLPCDLEKSNPTYNILALLRVLEALNQLASNLRVQAMTDSFSEGKISDLDKLSITGVKVPAEEFINNKLTPKLSRQIQDPLALCSESLPSWCYQLTKACPFLFPFETRRQYFYSTAFGLSRALHWLQQLQSVENRGSTNEREVRVGRLQRQKVRVSRNRILDSAVKVMEMYSGQKAVLEVEYFGEVGTGLGPTLEFYTLLSHDLQKVGLGMWRSNTMLDKSKMDIDNGSKVLEKADETSETKKLVPGSAAGTVEHVHAPLGLFPQPWLPCSDASVGSPYFKVIEYFRLLGRVMAKALQDGRLLDLPLSTSFYKLVLGQELDLHDILSFDPELGKILHELQAVVCRKQHVESFPGENYDAVSGLCFRGVPIEDLCLDFTLPGYPDYPLKQGGENIMVDIRNLEEYISLVVDATVKAGITQQMEAFKAGFNQVFDLSSLQIFSSHELDCLLCGRREMWKAETLVDHMKFDHGYTVKSPAIINFLEIMGEFTPEQQRAFCQFVTGAPRLPPGGLAVLNPKLTIVRKHSSTATIAASNGTVTAESADNDLPSVMTCANYLKLPPYSTKEIMFQKLIFAINEGQGSFDLS